ncbi:MAG: protoporphyrinogen oxidase [Chlamydiales bacterium]|nr:protoporphyrinogen oxidase [Chlamydiales bacterium]
MNRKQVVILGAGISGLSTAWFLKKRFGEQLNLKIIEKDQRVGGWIQTQRGSSFNLELGPRGFRPRGKGLSTLDLCYKLGLKEELIASDVTAKRRYVLYKNKLTPVPYNFNSFLSFPFKFQLATHLIKDYLHPKKIEKDISIYNFFRQRLGKSVSDGLVDPFFSGIYGGGTEQASCEACFPDLFNGVKKTGSLVKFLSSRTSPKKGYFSSASLLSFRRGMQCLPEALEEELKGEIKTGEEIVAIKRKNSKFILTASANQYSADIVISTLPYKNLANLLPEISSKLNVHYNSIKLLNLIVKKRDFPMSYKGFGYLIPSLEKLSLLGCVFDSFVFPEQEKDSGLLRLSLMFGGHHQYQNVKDLSGDELTQIGIETLNKHLKTRLTVLESKVFDAEEAIAVPLLGFNEKKEVFFKELETLMPDFYALGSSFNGAAINDCIYQAQNFVEGFSLNNSTKLKAGFCYT